MLQRSFFNGDFSADHLFAGYDINEIYTGFEAGNIYPVNRMIYGHHLLSGSGIYIDPETAGI